MATTVLTTGGLSLVTTAAATVITTAEPVAVSSVARSGRLKLVINGPSADAYILSNRRVALHAEHSLANLSWKFNLVEGGMQEGEARISMDRNSYVYDQLVRRGQSGVAEIIWVRDQEHGENYDAETDLLWVGLVEDAEVEQFSNLVKLRLRGAGSILEDLTFTGDFNGEKITDVAYEVLAATITSGSLVSARDVDAGGVLQRRVSKSYDRTPVSKILQDLAEAAGGPEMVAWGVRPPDTGATQAAIAYFKLFAAHLYEKDNTTPDPARAFSLGGSMASQKRMQFITSEIKNVVTVIGDRLESRPNEPIRYVAASAQSADSYNRYGRRYLTIQDSSLKNEGQCAAVAAGKVIELASRRVETEVEAIVPLINAPSIDQKAKNFINDTLLRPGKVFTVRDDGQNFMAWGDNQLCFTAARNATTPEYLRYEFTTPPSTDPPMLALTASLGSGNARIYIVCQARPAMVSPVVAAAVIELDRGIGVGWAETGAGTNVWKLGTYYRNAAHTWVNLSLSVTTYTTAQLANPHTVALEVSYNSATVHNVKTWVTLSGVSNAMNTDTLAVASISNTATTARLYLNALGTTAVDTPANAGDCFATEVIWFAAYKTWPSGSVTTHLQNVGTSRPPWKRYRDMVLLADFGKYDAANQLSLCRYSFNQVARRAAWDAHLIGASSIAASTSFTARNYSWLLGAGLYGRVLGTHVEVVPAEIEFRYGGPDAHLQVKIEGATGARTASAALQQLAVAVQEAQENARKSA